MRRNRVTKTVAVVELDEAVNSVELDWKNILSKAEIDVARSSDVHTMLPRDLFAGHGVGKSWRASVLAETDQVAFSTVTIDSAEAVHHDMEDVFSKAREFFEQYRLQLISSENKLVKFEAFKSDASLRVDELLLENEELQLSLFSSGSHVGPDRRDRRHRAQHRDPSGSSAAAKDDLWHDLLRSDDSSGADDTSILLDGGSGHWRVVYNRAVRWLPLQRDLARTHLALGGSVGAYFTFVRTVFISCLLLSILFCFASAIHIYNIGGIALSAVSSTVGFLPQFLFISSFSKKEGSFYLGLIIFGTGFFILSSLFHFINEDKVAKYVDATKGKDTRAYCDVFLMGWDNSIGGSTASDGTVESAFQGTAGAGRELIERLARKGGKTDDNNWREILQGLKRFCAVIFYMCFQLACYVLLSYLTTAHELIGSKESSLYQAFRIGLIPLVLSLYNNIFPYIIRVITRFEKWETSAELWILTARLYISMISNLTIIGVSYGLLADPLLMAGDGASFVRLRLEQEFFPGSFGCRLNQVGYGLAVAILIDLVVYISVTIFLQTSRKLGAIFLLNDNRPMEFSLANSMVSILYLVGLLVMVVPFSPLLMIFAPLVIFIRFKFEIFTTLRCCMKPTAFHLASQVRRTFSIYYFATAAYVGLCSICFVLASRSFAKSCTITDLSVGLCASALDPITDTCDLDAASDYFSLYNNVAYCEHGYPACICSEDLICGPFVTDYAAIDPLRRYAKGIPSLSLIWFVFMELSAAAWLFVLILGIVVAFRTNSYQITKEITEGKEHYFSQQVDSLVKDIQKQNKIIERAKDI